MAYTKNIKSEKTDACIIGAGVAGILCAHRLSQAGIRVTLLESGGVRPTYTDAYTFINKGLPMRHQSRIQGFGGTSSRWDGRWKLFDDAEIVSWGLDKNDFAHYYEEAARIFGVLNERADLKLVNRVSGGDLNITSYSWVPKKNLHVGKLLGKKLENSGFVTALLNTRALRISHTEDGAVVHAKQNGESIEIHAARVVVATGGLETPRLLLTSGVGGPAVGKYYMDHPKGVVGVIEFDKGWSMPNGYNARVPMMGLCLSEGYRKKYNLLNPYILLVPFVETAYQHFCARFGLPIRAKKMHVRNFMEQEPRAENKIVLSTEVDSDGVPRAEIQWDIYEKDKEALVRLHEILNENLKKVGGKLIKAVHIETPWRVNRDGGHHMGATRMGNDQETSVVDQRCRIHDAPHIYVASSAVFPTSGNANPTATIAAFALRIADDIHKEIKKNRVAIIGSGRRVQETILPALQLAKEGHELVGIYAREKKTIQFGGKSIEVQNDVSTIDLSRIDALIIAIPHEHVLSVLKKLPVERGNTTLIADTPIVPVSHLWKCLKHFRQFKKVLGGEDCIALPPYEQFEKADVANIDFLYSGFSYHAIGATRFLCGNIKKVKKWKEGNRRFTTWHAGNTLCTMVEPRDYDIGVTTFRLKNGGEHRIEYKDNAEMKISGYAKLLNALVDGKSPYQYSVWNALDDAAVVRGTLVHRLYIKFCELASKML